MNSRASYPAALLGIFLLSAATLAFEINLTRLFSVAQFYHFAFMIVSIALMGYGASGTALTIFPRLKAGLPLSRIGLYALATSLCMLVSYLLTNWLPFDSFSIAWDNKQIAILVIHYLTLASPFFFNGLAIGYLLATSPKDSNRTYALNLTGAAVGCSLALFLPGRLGGEGMVMLSVALAALSAIVCSLSASRLDKNRAFPVLTTKSKSSWSVYILTLILILLPLYDISTLFVVDRHLPVFSLKISPYKSLSYAMQYPGAALIHQEWNSFSRVDVVRSGGIRSLPGLSFRYLKSPPLQDGLLVDGDELSPILLADNNLEFTSYLPQALAYDLIKSPKTLILGPRGGLDIVTAIALGASEVEAVEVNSLIIEAANDIYDQPGLQIIVDSERSFLRHTKDRFDVIVLSLGSSYHPIQSGAYSLSEDYSYTVEAFQDALALLKPGGIFTTMRWQQSPPSESLRAFAITLTALEKMGIDPIGRIVILRGYNTASIFIKNGVFSAADLRTIRNFANSRAFDLVYSPDLQPEETNHYSVLKDIQEDLDFSRLLTTIPHESFYRTYPYEISPPTDDKPFFGHFFKWSQTNLVLAEMGKTWQPFGGAGFFVILAILFISTGLAVFLILLPVGVLQYQEHKNNVQPTTLSTETSPSLVHQSMIQPGGWKIPLVYFSLLGLAYLMVEIPLIQKFILYLGHPAYSMTAVLFTLLFFSGVGSLVSTRVPQKWALVILLLLLFASPYLFPWIFKVTLGYTIYIRFGITLLILAPIGFLMGIPFPAGISRLSSYPQSSPIIPWVWAVNGSTSVISSILSALIAISFGFAWVLRLGAFCYLGVLVTLMVWSRRRTAESPRQ